MILVNNLQIIKHFCNNSKLVGFPQKRAFKRKKKKKKELSGQIVEGWWSQRRRLWFCLRLGYQAHLRRHQLESQGQPHSPGAGAGVKWTYKVSSRVRGEEDLRNYCVQSTIPRKETEASERTKPNFLTFRSLRSTLDTQVIGKRSC